MTRKADISTSVRLTPCDVAQVVDGDFSGNLGGVLEVHGRLEVCDHHHVGWIILRKVREDEKGSEWPKRLEGEQK